MPVNMLFVDDEQLILQSVKRVMRSKKVDIFLADSADAAFKVLENENIDIVVTDVRMPDINGIDFLKEVRRLYPNIYRLILSGQVERDDVLNAILQGVAFEYLTKPWKKEILRAKLNHIIEIQEQLSNEKIVNLINTISRLPKNMEVIRSVESAINKEESIEHIGDIIIKDLSITTKILQMVNSAFYTRKRISSIHQAISILGLNTVKSLIFTSSFMEEDHLSQWQKDANANMMTDIIHVNRVYVLLYKHLTDEKLPDEFSSFGLLYNIGKLIILNYFPERYLEIMKHIASDEKGYYHGEIELGYKGETHQEIGAYFLDLWNFSKANVEVALFHHDNERASEEYREAFSILNKASEIAKTIDSEIFEHQEDLQAIIDQV